MTFKSADDDTKAAIELLMPYEKHVHTITADSEREFADHETVAQEPGAMCALLILTVFGNVTLMRMRIVVEW